MAEFTRPATWEDVKRLARYLADRGVTGWITWNGVGPATQTIGTPENRNVVIRWAPVR